MSSNFARLTSYSEWTFTELSELESLRGYCGHLTTHAKKLAERNIYFYVFRGLNDILGGEEIASSFLLTLVEKRRKLRNKAVGKEVYSELIDKLSRVIL